MAYYLIIGGLVGILTFCLIYGGIGWLVIEFDHKRKCRQMRKEWERQNKWTRSEPV